MKLLLTNDDGVNAAGIVRLHQVLSQVFDDITVVAPDRNCSASSHGITLMNPLRVDTLANGFMAVNGTPADCVNVALDHLMTEKPDVVISGINHGPNLGQDVIYSGTVAAAIEAQQFGVPSIAVSLTGGNLVHYDTAAKVIAALLNQYKLWPNHVDKLCNVNVPSLPEEQLQGIKLTKLGSRQRAAPMTKLQDPWGRDIYWYGKLGQHIPGEQQPGDQQTDFNAVAEGYASVTPLTLDWTAHQTMSCLTQWIDEVKLT